MVTISQKSNIKLHQNEERKWTYLRVIGLFADANKKMSMNIDHGITSDFLSGERKAVPVCVSDKCIFGFLLHVFASLYLIFVIHTSLVCTCILHFVPSKKTISAYKLRLSKANQNIFLWFVVVLCKSNLIKGVPSEKKKSRHMQVWFFKGLVIVTNSKSNSKSTFQIW